jgi:hypothetical protein
MTAKTPKKKGRPHQRPGGTKWSLTEKEEVEAALELFDDICRRRGATAKD